MRPFAEQLQSLCACLCAGVCRRVLTTADPAVLHADALFETPFQASVTTLVFSPCSLVRYASSCIHMCTLSITREKEDEHLAFRSSPFPASASIVCLMDSGAIRQKSSDER